MKSLRSKMALASLIMGLGVSHSGIALAAFDSFGNGIPLDSAARQIAPEGTKVEYGAGVDKSAPISWKQSGDWQGALSSAVAKKGLKAEFNDNGVTIVKAEAPAATARPYSSTPSETIVQRRHATHQPRVAHAPRPHRAPVSAPREEEASTSSNSGTSGFVIRAYHSGSAPVQGDKVAPVQGKGMVDKDFAPNDGRGQASTESQGKFIVEDGFKLHGTLETWASSTGWTVIWNSDHDYLIQANATFSGDFVKASSDLITAMGDARPQITVDYYRGNHVIVISNKLSGEANK